MNMKKQIFKIKRFHRQLFNEFEWAMDELTSMALRKIRTFRKKQEIKHWVVFEE